MERCIEAFQRKVKETPFFELVYKSTLGNSFVQTLIFILVGVIILFFAKGENKEIINTVGVTIITASLFKFLLSANAFTKVISKVIRDSFVELDFIKDYTKTKLFKVLDNVTSEILDRNYKHIKEPLKKEIFNILGEQNGYYKSLKIEYTDITNTKGITETTNITTIENVSRFKENYRVKMTYELIPKVDMNDHFKLEYVKVNRIKLDNVEVKIETKSKNGTELVSFIYEFPLEEGQSHIEIKSKALDNVTEHAFFMKKTCSNVKVIYKFDDTIIEPSIISKYGETDLQNSRYSDCTLEEYYGEKPFFKSEFLFIKYKRKKEC